MNRKQKNINNAIADIETKILKLQHRKAQLEKQREISERTITPHPEVIREKADQIKSVTTTQEEVNPLMEEKASSITTNVKHVQLEQDGILDKDKGITLLDWSSVPEDNILNAESFEAAQLQQKHSVNEAFEDMKKVVEYRGYTHYRIGELSDEGTTARICRKLGLERC